MKKYRNNEPMPVKKSKPKHTRGHWHAVNFAGYWRISSSPYYQGRDLLDEDSEPKAEANAKLAAQAPKMWNIINRLRKKKTPFEQLMKYSHKYDISFNFQMWGDKGYNIYISRGDVDLWSTGRNTPEEAIQDALDWFKKVKATL